MRSLKVITGRPSGVRLILPFVDAKVMTVFLAHTSAQFPGEHCVIFLNGAGWHKAHDLIVPANMTLVPLPPYSPELNPAEHVWEYIRENNIRNQVFEDCLELVDLGKGLVMTMGLLVIQRRPELQGLPGGLITDARGHVTLVDCGEIKPPPAGATEGEGAC